MTRPVSTLTGPQARQWSVRKPACWCQLMSYPAPARDLTWTHSSGGAAGAWVGPCLGSSLGWVYQAMVTACSAAVLILELF